MDALTESAFDTKLRKKKKTVMLHHAEVFCVIEIMYLA
jgi:hypothetical protein